MSDAALDIYPLSYDNKDEKNDDSEYENDISATVTSPIFVTDWVLSVTKPPIPLVQ